MKPTSKLWWHRPETRDSLCELTADGLAPDSPRASDAIRFYRLYTQSLVHRDAPAVANLRRALRRAKISTAVPRGMVSCPKCGALFKRGGTCPNYREGFPT